MMVEYYRFLDKAYDEVWRGKLDESYLLFKYEEKLPNGLIAAPGLFSDRSNESVDLVVADEVGGEALLKSYPDGLYCVPRFNDRKWLKYQSIMSFRIYIENAVADENQMIDGDIIGVFVAFGADTTL